MPPIDPLVCMTASQARPNILKASVQEPIIDKTLVEFAEYLVDSRLTKLSLNNSITCTHSPTCTAQRCEPPGVRHWLIHFQRYPYTRIYLQEHFTLPTNIPFIPIGPDCQSLASVRRAHSAQY